MGKISKKKIRFSSDTSVFATAVAAHLAGKRFPSVTFIDC
jgi:hypothetical protein